MTLTAQALADRLRIPLRAHPAAVECCERAEAWARRYDDLDGAASPAKVRAWGFGVLAAGMFPDADLELLALAADFTNWIAVVDDRVETDAGQTASLRAAHVQAGDGPRGALVAAWRDVERRLIAGAPSAFAQRVRLHLGALFDAYDWEAGFRDAGRIPSLDAFRQHRHVSGGLPLYLMILERACGGAPARSPSLDALDQRIGNLTCWANDLLSHHWDRDTQNPINLVRVLEAQVGPALAIDAAVAAFEAEWQGWRTTQLSAPAIAATPYVTRQPALVAGALGWMERTARYRASNPTRR